MVNGQNLRTSYIEWFMVCNRCALPAPPTLRLFPVCPSLGWSATTRAASVAAKNLIAIFPLK
jgi:hypothetical protein